MKTKYTEWKPSTLNENQVHWMKTKYWIKTKFKFQPAVRLTVIHIKETPALLAINGLFVKSDR